MSEYPVLIGTGDIVLTKAFAQVDPDPLFDRTQRQLARADLAVSSLEIAFSDRGAPSDRILNFRTAPELLGELKHLSLDVVSLANNHSSDYGWDALKDTINGLSKAGIGHVGAGKTIDEAEFPHFAQVNGLRIAYVAWSCLLPMGIAAGRSRPGIAPIHIGTSWDVNPEFQMEEPGVSPTVHTWASPGDIDRVQARIRAIRDEADFVVVGIHWGFGFGAELATYQRPLGHALIDAGADIILGHHVHCPQGIESYRGKVIVYSHGNFVAQQPRDGITKEIDAIYRAFSDEAFMSEILIRGPHRAEVRLVPLRTNKDGLPAIAVGQDFERIAAHIRDRSRALGTDVNIHDDRLLVGSGYSDDHQ